ncbi:hypothetical protein [Psychroflexus sp. MES1-P1E]|uniref:hypothetical protein n=1 Tax=Psychroflexus sp. MES1-P1E TaxID=2058320 RepID=UPI000C797278|nr:hypothetical protein [Psychroflexus sp. MES1-P1E]PKG43361.1 hypothetical protein CXF67_05405 [Psychroflexus sp. MES1-P1E]
MTTQFLLLLLLNFACALGLAFILYQKLLQDKTQRVLAFFRFLSFFLIGLLLINPEINSTELSIEKPKLTFAIDNSESIHKLSDSRKINDFIKNIRTDDELNSKYDLNFFSFGNQFDILTDTLGFTESSTNISKVIDYTYEISKEESSSFVMLTDGNQTFGEDYYYKSLPESLSSSILVLGDTTSYKDSKIDFINLNEFAYLNNEFPLELFVSQNTSINTTQTLSIVENNVKIASRSITIPAKGSTKVEFLLRAKPVGMKLLKAELEPLQNEKNLSNNKKSISIEVIDYRSKILLISDIIHPDLGFFKRILETNKEMELFTKTTSDFIDYSEYDLLILYQPQSSFRKVFSEIKANQLNYFLIGGSQTDYGFLNRSDLGFKKELILSTEEYSAIINTDFSLFQIEDLNFKSYPPVLDKFGDINLTTNFSMFLNKKANGVELDSPLWMYDADSNIKRSFLFGENLWKWRASYYVMYSDFEKFDQNFQKILRYLSQAKSKNYLSVEVSPVINSGESNKLRAKYYDANFEVNSGFNFSIRFENLETKNAIESKLISDGDGFTYNLSDLEPGTYAYKIKGINVDISKVGQFQILNYSSELQFENANYKGLRQLAEEKDLYLFSNREELISNLKSKDVKSIQKSIQKAQGLVDFELLILLLALTLSSEWSYRKYKGLI